MHYWVVFSQFSRPLDSKADHLSGSRFLRAQLHQFSLGLQQRGIGGLSRLHFKVLRFFLLLFSFLFLFNSPESKAKVGGGGGC